MHFHLSTPHGPLEIDLEVPVGAVHLHELVPALRALASAVATHTAAAAGPISCGPACGACCRQLVPVSAPEMRAMAAEVEALPPPRRDRVKQRFAEAIAELDHAGLTDALRSPPAEPDAYRALLVATFAARVACPFLEDESCSIHATRPTICREYSVTSAPAACTRPFSGHVVVVEPPANVANLVAEVIRRRLGGRLKVTPLTLALEWVARHPDPGPRVPAGEVVAEVVGLLQDRWAPHR